MRSSLARTVVLGCIAATVGIWWLGRAYEVENARLVGYLLSSVAFIAFMALLGLAGAGVFWLWRRWRRASGRRE